MATPTFPSDGGSSKVDALVDAAGTTTFKRGYVRETPSGSSVDTMHVGIMQTPASVFAASSTVTPGTVTVSLPLVSVGTNYLQGFSITGSGATTPSVVHATITGLQATWGIDIAVPSGNLTTITPIFQVFGNPIPASAPSTAITLTVPSFGTGSSVVSVAIWGTKST